MNADPHPPRPDPSPAPLRWRQWLARLQLRVGYRIGGFSSLFLRGLNSLQQRGAGTTLRLVARRLFPLRLKPYPLHLYHEPVEAGSLRLPSVPAPIASIIVPVYGQLALTLRCLRALAQSGDATAFEVIVVDDASPDDSAEVLPRVEGLRYARNPGNLGFIGTCNAGADLARGSMLVFLNNDTVAQPGWLDALLATFDAFPDTGIAGSKLVYPDGRLQEAGGVLYRSGRAGNVGKFADPGHPSVNFVREVDYCSGAAIAIPTTLFRRLHGFDSHFAPAYYEDADIAMRVRELGLKVRYQPASVVVHLEGASSGTDTRRGVKSYQTLNEIKFRERWVERLASHPADPGPREIHGEAELRATRHRCRRRILVIDAYTPTPDRDAGSLRMSELLGLLVEEGCSVLFFCQNMSHDGTYTQALQQRGVEVWWQPWLGSLPRWLASHGASLDAVVVSRHYVLQPLLPMLRALAPGAQLVFDTVDLHFLRERREAEHSESSNARQSAARTHVAETGLMAKVDVTWVVSEVEREMLADMLPSARVEVVSTVHRVVEGTPGFDSRLDLLFVGSFRHPPNVDAARWLVEAILPRIRARLPDVVLHLVGADAPEAIVALGQSAGVQRHGHVPALDSLMDTVRVSVAPLRYGAGIKGKINHSLARGLPVVATSCATEGMFLIDGIDVLRADTADTFAEAVLRAHDDAALWQRLRDGGLENTRRHFSPETARSALRRWLQRLPATD